MHRKVIQKVEQNVNPRLTLIGLSGTGVRSENWDLVHQTLSANCNRSGTELDVHERLVPVMCRCYSRTKNKRK